MGGQTRIENGEKGEQRKNKGETKREYTGCLKICVLDITTMKEICVHKCRLRLIFQVTDYNNTFSASF